MDGKLFEEMVEADILLYYLSLAYVKTEDVYDMWYPELSIYNSSFTILPKLVSSRYLEKAKLLFGVDDKESFITRIKGLKDHLQRDGCHHIPSLLQGLGLDKICSFKYNFSKNRIELSYDTKSNSLLLVWKKSITRVCTKVH